MLARTPKFAFLYVNEKSFSGRILLAREPGPEGRAAVFVPEGLAAAPAAVRRSAAASWGPGVTGIIAKACPVLCVFHPPEDEGNFDFVQRLFQDLAGIQKALDAKFTVAQTAFAVGPLGLALGSDLLIQGHLHPAVVLRTQATSPPCLN